MNDSADFDVEKKSTLQEDESNWLVSYADMMTLLFGFFVIISSFSTPDPSKLEKLKEATVSGMGGKYINSYEELSDEIKKVLKSESIDKIGIENLPDGIKLTSNATSFFSSSSAKISPSGLKFITALAPVIKNKAKNFIVYVEGHTDDLPIHTKEFPDNWVLSLIRSRNVVYEFEKKGIIHNKLRPVGMGDIHPLINVNTIPKNNTDQIREARAKNRRIIIRLKKVY